MNKAKKKTKVALICSSGGHFYELYSIRKFCENSAHFWITFPTSDTKSILKDDKVYWAYYPTNRNLKNLFKNIILAFQILKKEKPSVIISTGAGVCVPFMYMAKIFGIKTVYLESMTRIESLSLSAKLVYPIVDHILVQWSELAKKYKKTKFTGTYL